MSWIGKGIYIPLKCKHTLAFFPISLQITLASYNSTHMELSINETFKISENRVPYYIVPILTSSLQPHYVKYEEGKSSSVRGLETQLHSTIL